MTGKFTLTFCYVCDQKNYDWVYETRINFNRMLKTYDIFLPDQTMPDPQKKRLPFYDKKSLLLCQRYLIHGHHNQNLQPVYNLLNTNNKNFLDKNQLTKLIVLMIKSQPQFYKKNHCYEMIQLICINTQQVEFVYDKKLKILCNLFNQNKKKTIELKYNQILNLDDPDILGENTIVKVPNDFLSILIHRIKDFFSLMITQIKKIL